VVLGDHEIKEQGTWQEIKAKAANIAKFTTRPHEKNNSLLAAGFNKLNVQVREKDEAEGDLSRQTGDFSLYGNYARKRNPGIFITDLNSLLSFAY